MGGCYKFVLRKTIHKGPAEAYAKEHLAVWTLIGFVSHAFMPGVCVISDPCRNGVDGILKSKTRDL